MDSNIDKGGSYAIRGFNYQNTVSVYILILNHADNDFFLIPEGKDDIEVFKKNIHYYLQVKSKRMTKSSFVKADKNKDGTTKESVIEKLINKTKEGKYNKYKIVCTGISEGLIDYKAPQKTSIFCETNDTIYKLDKERIDQGNLEQDIDIFIPGFKEKNKDRSLYLLGVLVQNNISVDNGRGRNILNILKELIDYKSEIPLLNIQSYEDKKIKGYEINDLFVNDKKYQEMKEYYYELVESLKYPVEEKIGIKMLYNKFSYIENDDEYIKLREILRENNMLDKCHKFSNGYIDECRKILSKEINILNNDEINSKIIYCYLWEVLDFDN